MTNKKSTTNNNGSKNNKTNNKNVHSNKNNTKNKTNAASKKNVPKKPTPKNESALDHKCPGCAAPIFFVPSVGKWKCEYCDGAYTLEELQKHNNASSLKHNPSETPVVENTVDDAVQDLYTSYKCQSCGAEIVADNQTAATFCVYCGNTAILKSKLSGEFKPDMIIPFKTEKQQAIKAFQDLSKGRPFLPADFTSLSNIEKIRGIYIPFWLYDMVVIGGIEGRGQIVTSWSRGDTHYTKTDYYKLYRDGSIKYLKVPIDGSSRFDNDIMSTIEPYDYNELVPYNHAYLSGFLAERFDIDGDTLAGNAIVRCVESTKTVFLSDASGYSTKSIYTSTLRASDIYKHYALLPVWMVNVKYKDKYYLFAMNGQTGEFIGDMPVDTGKVIKWSIITALSVFLAVIIIAYLLFKLGGNA